MDQSEIVDHCAQKGMRPEMSDKIEVPFTVEQVDALNFFQRLGHLHPFTCPGHAGGGDRGLVATRSGWICCHCSYTQNWAHDVMVEIGAREMARAKLISGASS